MSTFVIVPTYYPSKDDCAFWTEMARRYYNFIFFLIHDGPLDVLDCDCTNLNADLCVATQLPNLYFHQTPVKSGIPSSLNTGFALAISISDSANPLFFIFDQDTRFDDIYISESARIAHLQEEPIFLFPDTSRKASLWPSIFKLPWVQYSGIGLSYNAYKLCGTFDELLPINHGDIEYLARLYCKSSSYAYTVKGWHHMASPNSRISFLGISIVVHRHQRLIIALRSSWRLLWRRRTYPHVKLQAAVLLFIADIIRLVFLKLLYSFSLIR